MDFIDLIEKRHSVRSYKNESVSEEVLNKIVECAKLAPTSRNKKPCEYVVVTDKTVLEKLAQSKAAGSQMLKDAGAAIVVIGDSEKSDVWVEDCSIAMTYLHLAACNFGLGSCWVQIRNRTSAEKEDSETVVKRILEIQNPYKILAILSVGAV